MGKLFDSNFTLGKISDSLVNINSKPYSTWSLSSSNLFNFCSVAWHLYYFDSESGWQMHVDQENRLIYHLKQLLPFHLAVSKVIEQEFIRFSPQNFVRNVIWQINNLVKQNEEISLELLARKKGIREFFYHDEIDLKSYENDIEKIINNASKLLNVISEQSQNSIVYCDKFFSVELNKVTLLSYFALVYQDKYGNIRCIEITLDKKNTTQYKYNLIKLFFSKKFAINHEKLFFDRITPDGVISICATQLESYTCLYRKVLIDLRKMKAGEENVNCENCLQCNFRGCCNLINKNTLNHKAIESINIINDQLSSY